MDRKTINKLIKLGFTLITGFTLSACSMIPDIPKVPVPGMARLVGEEGLFKDRKGEYLEAQTIPRTRIPAHLDSFVIDDLMVIPQIDNPRQTAFIDAPRPISIGAREQRGVVIQRQGDENWIVVDASPSQVWPRVRDYWLRNNIQLAFENPTRGVMDTSWFVLDGNPVTKEKLRVTIEPGFQNDSAEIRLLHLGVSQALPTFEQVNWPDKSTDPLTEYDLLTSLSEYLAGVTDLYQASTISFLAENIDNAGKARIQQTPAGQRILHLEADYNRSWAAIGRALQRAGIEVAADNFDLGIYEVDYTIVEEEEEPGFFSKLVTLNGLFSRDEGAVYYPLKIQLLDLGDSVEVLVESTELLPVVNEESSEAASSLLQLIRNTIA